MSTPRRLTTADLADLPEALDSTRFELIAGNVYLCEAEHWRHQAAGDAITRLLTDWDDQAGHGLTVPTPTLLLSLYDSVVPDVTWTRRERLRGLITDEGYFSAAPDLVIEVLSLDPAHHQRDVELKRALYAHHGVGEYWIVDWRARRVHLFQRQLAALRYARTLNGADLFTSPLLPGFARTVADLCASPL